MTPKERCAADEVFSALVDVLEAMLRANLYTPVDLLEGAAYAAERHEARPPLQKLYDTPCQLPHYPWERDR